MNTFEECLEAMQQVERSMATLYRLYSTAFIEDEGFWRQLSYEEEGHAVIVETLADMKDHLDDDLVRLLAGGLDEVRETNDQAQATIKAYRASMPDQSSAAQRALELERSAGEAHYHALVRLPTDNEAVKIIQGLRDDDKDHLERIRAHGTRLLQAGDGA